LDGEEFVGAADDDETDEGGLTHIHYYLSAFFFNSLLLDYDDETVDMFQEISKGKDFISVKQLLKWDEIKELISSELVSQEIIDGYGVFT